MDRWMEFREKEELGGDEEQRRMKKDREKEKEGGGGGGDGKIKVRSPRGELQNCL